MELAAFIEHIMASKDWFGDYLHLFAMCNFVFEASATYLKLILLHGQDHNRQTWCMLSPDDKSACCAQEPCRHKCSFASAITICSCLWLIECKSMNLILCLCSSYCIFCRTGGDF